MKSLISAVMMIDLQKQRQLFMRSVLVGIHENRNKKSIQGYFNEAAQKKNTYFKTYTMMLLMGI
jgi:uncharacterized protein YcgL (UPF0745 family)